MCVICNSAENKISITGLNGKICKSCHENILLIRQNHLKEAGEYFSGIDFASAESRKFIENEFSKKHSSIDLAKALPSVSAEEKQILDKQTDSAGKDYPENTDRVLNKIASDINTIKNILLFFLIISCAGIIGMIIYISKLVSLFNHIM